MANKSITPARIDSNHLSSPEPTSTYYDSNHFLMVYDLLFSEL